MPKISAAKPVCRNLRRNEFVKNRTNPNFAIREIDGENDQLTAGNTKGRWRITQIMISMDQNQKKLTQTRDRSETKYGLFLGNFQIFGGKEFRGEILGNQKLLIPICCGVPTRVARCSRIPVELAEGFVRTRGKMRRKRRTRRTRRILTHTTRSKG